MDTSNVFHDGALVLQARFGDVESAARNGQSIADASATAPQWYKSPVPWHSRHVEYVSGQ